MKFTQHHYTLPGWAICPLVNGDETGISDDERADLAGFISTLPGPGHWAIGERTEFAISNDVDSYAGEVYAATYYTPNTEGEQ